MGNVLKSIDPWFLYLLFYIPGVLAAVKFGLASAWNNSTLGVGLAAGFFIMATVGFILLNPFFNLINKEGFFKKKTNFSQHLHSFWAAVIFGGVVSILGVFSSAFSVFTQPFQMSTVFATATEGLSSFDQVIANTGMAPNCETFIFVADFVFAIIVIKLLTKVLHIENKTLINIIMLSFYTLFTFVTFFLFHIGMVGSTAFLIAVFVYRAMMGVFIWGDSLFNIIPFMTVVMAFEFGYHWILNVTNTVGILEWFLVLSTDVFGMIFIGTMALLFILELYNIKNWKGEDS